MHCLGLILFLAMFSVGDSGKILDERDKKAMVDAHNNARRKENAANMNMVSWDDSLATLALIHAENCIFKHVIPKVPETIFFSIGQNIYIRSPYIQPDMAHVTGMWVAEKVNYTYATTKCKGVCEHYTQVVWADTAFIGCAIHNCTTMAYLPKAKSITNVVCNYGPAGNYPSMLPYEEGEPCEMCSGDCEDGLCLVTDY